MNVRMNEEIKDRWVAALRSGEFEQRKHRLNLNDKYCCLGVLSELAYSDGVCEKTESVSVYKGFSYDGRLNSLPDSVIEWAGLIEWADLSQDMLMRLNDRHGFTFDQIADYIEGKGPWEKSERPGQIPCRKWLANVDRSD